MLSLRASVIWSVVLLAAGSTASLAQNVCDRACLRTTLDQYLSAVVENDPGAALAAGRAHECGLGRAP